MFGPLGDVNSSLDPRGRHQDSWLRGNTSPFLLFLVLLFCSLLCTSLLHHLLVLCLPPQQFLHPFLVFRLDLSVDPLLKITEQWRGLQQMQLLQNKKNHARCHMTQNNYYTTLIHHHLVNAALTKCRLKRKTETHPIPLPIRVLFIGLGYPASIAAKAHGHWNTTRQRQ